MYRTWCHLWWTGGQPWRFGFFQRKQQMKWWQVSHLHILGGFIFLGGHFEYSQLGEMIQFWLLRISDGWLNPPTSITWIFARLHGRKHWTKSGLHCHPLELKWWESTNFWEYGGTYSNKFVWWRSLLTYTIDNKNLELISQIHYEFARVFLGTQLKTSAY